MGDLGQVQENLKKVDHFLEGTPLETVFLNAARTGKSNILDFPIEVFENDLKVCRTRDPTLEDLLTLHIDCNRWFYAVAQWAISKLLNFASSDNRTPSLLVTSGMLAKDPFPAMFSLASCKAGQYSLVNSLHKKFEPKGVHCGLAIIGGTVSDESKVTNARNIAEEILKMSMQEKGKGSLELVLSDPACDEHVKNREKRN